MRHTNNNNTQKHKQSPKRGLTPFLRQSLLCLFIIFSSTLPAQKIDERLFSQFEKHFQLLDSLIFGYRAQTQHQALSTPDAFSNAAANKEIDSLLTGKIEKETQAMKAETGLLISGQTYYRLDEGLGTDDDDALSQYNAKIQIEMRWNILSSSLINRKSRLKEIELKGELERAQIEKKQINELVEQQILYFGQEYDSLLAGILRLRIDNLQLLNDAQQYLVSDRSIGTDELLKILDEQAIAERQLAAIPRDYPLAAQLIRPEGAIISIDTASIMRHIVQSELSLQAANLQIELLQQQEKNTNYWRTLNISPYIRYSFYSRPELRNSSNVDAGVTFQIPLNSQEARKRNALKAERLQKSKEKELLTEQIKERVNQLFLEIERANRGLKGEQERIKKMRDYIALRRANYKGHIGEYNFMSRIKEYNHYLTCWENYYSYQYKRDCCIAELQNYLNRRSVLEFCTIVKTE